MKAEHAKRAAILMEALGDVDFLEKQMKRAEPADGYDMRGVEIRVSDLDRDGSGCSQGAMILDLDTGKLLLPRLKDLILSELKDLGVQVDE